MKLIYLIALIPFIGFLSGGFLLRFIPSLVFGMPFLLIWNLSWMVACTVCLLIIYRHDRRHEEAQK